MAFKRPSSSAAVPTDPEQLYRQLALINRGPEALWLHQGDVLRAWHRDHPDASDVAIELPTGAGKALVGGLIGEYRRRVAQERVAYLCPTRQLARQTAAKLTEYGIPNGRAGLVTGHADRARVRGAPPRRRWLRDRRIRTKLGLILLLPVLTVLALTGVSVASAARRAADAGQARELVAVGGTAARLAAQVQRERATAALVFAGSNSGSAMAGYRQQGEATDRVVAALQAGVDGVDLPDNFRPR